jgi:hypothetical protein
MELIMLAQLYAGMRGLGHTFRAVGAFLPAIGDPPAGTTAAFPDGWDVDPDSIRCGLDLTTLHVTDHDRAAITSWYEQTIGYLPRSIETGLRYDPAFIKMQRAKWEAAIRTLPKQVIPYLQIRLNMMSGSVPGLREAALLARAWGITRTHAIKGVTASAMYFTSLEGLYTMHEAMADILEDWPDEASASGA